MLMIFLVVFFDLVGFGIVIPILPYYAQEYGANAWQLGWLMTLYSLMQFLVAPLWGRLSDIVGRRPVLLVSILGSVGSMLILGFAPSLGWLYLGRFLAGVCGANISTAYAYIADVTTEENRAKGMGAIGAAFGLGFIFGPAIGGLLSRYGYSAPMFAGAAMAAANFVFALFLLKEPPLSAEARSGNRSRRFDRQAFATALGDERSRLAIGTFFLFTMAVTQMEVIFGLYLLQRFGYDAQTAGLLLALIGILMVMIQGGLIGRLNRTFGEIRLILFGALSSALGLIGFALAENLSVLVASLSVLAIGHGVMHPSLSTLASKGASISHRGATMGVFHSASALARILGPLIAGWLFDRFSPAAPFYMGAVFVGVAGTWVIWRTPGVRNISPVLNNK